MTVNGPGPITTPITPVGPAGALAPNAGTAPAQPTDTTGAPSVSAPSGTNPELWQVLTPAEQAFFAERAALGPITYGPAKASPSPLEAPRGQRIDVRA